MPAATSAAARPPSRLGFRERIAPLSERRVPTIVLAILVTLATWTPSFNYPVTGLDPSWGGGLYIAIEDGIRFGTDFVFTYGPLGFLNIPVNWDTNLASITFAWLVLLHLALCFALVWALRDSVGALMATLLAFFAIAELSFSETPFVLGIALSFAALKADRPRHAVTALALGGAGFVAVMTLVKLSIGPPLIAVFLVALIGARASRRHYAAFGGVLVTGILALWLILGQTLGDLPDYVTNGRQIISGYSEAMVSNDGSELIRTLAPFAALAVAAFFAAGSWFLDYRDPRARLFGVIVASLVAFSMFKEGVVRMDVGHLLLYFSTMGLAWLALPWSRSRRPLLIGGTAFMLVAPLALSYHISPTSLKDPLKVTSSVDRAFTQIDLLFSPGERTFNSAFARAFMQVYYDVDERALADLEGHTVSAEPAEIGLIWAYELDWEPLPVIQNYSAYTAELDELNAGAIEAADGPERIVRANTGAAPGDEGRLQAIDGRFPAWDPPAQAIAELCNFVPLDTTDRIQVLGRVPERCSEPVEVGSVSSSYGETVDVPEAGRGEVVFVRIDGAGVSGFESVRALLFRAKLRFLQVDDRRRYRLVPGTAADGLMLRGDRRITGTGEFAQTPQAKTIKLVGDGGDLRYDFYSMEVTSGPGDEGGNVDRPPPRREAARDGA